MPPNTTTTTTATSGTANGTAGGGGSGGEWLPNGWELLRGALTGALRDFTDGVAGLVDLFNRSLLTLPAVGSATDPATWVQPHDPFWIAVSVVYTMLSAFVLPMVWGVGWFNVAYPRGVQRQERLKSFVTAFVLILCGWTLLQGWFHFWNEATVAFAPSGDEFLSTPGNATKLGLGVVLGVAILLWNALVILGGLLLHLFFVLLTFVFVALWPLSVGLYATDFFAVDAMGASGIMGTLLLGPLQFVKGVILRLIFEFPLDVQQPETATTFILIIIGVMVAFIGVPYFGLKRLLPRSIIAAGGRVGTKGRHQSQDRIQQLQERVPSGQALREKVRANSRLGTRGESQSTGSSLQSRTRSQPDVDFSSATRLRDSRNRRMNDTRTRTRDFGDD